MNLPDKAAPTARTSRARRWSLNLGLLLVVALGLALYTSIYLSSESAEDPALLLFPYTLLLLTGLLLPGAVVYLWVLDVLRPQTSRSTRRAVAVGLSPLVGLGAWIFLGIVDGEFREWASFVVAAVIYAGIVRVRAPEAGAPGS